jgi:hypothetical protein
MKKRYEKQKKSTEKKELSITTKKGIFTHEFIEFYEGVKLHDVEKVDILKSFSLLYNF